MSRVSLKLPLAEALVVHQPRSRALSVKNCHAANPMLHYFILPGSESTAETCNHVVGGGYTCTGILALGRLQGFRNFCGATEVFSHRRQPRSFKTGLKDDQDATTFFAPPKVKSYTARGILTRNPAEHLLYRHFTCRCLSSSSFVDARMSLWFLLRWRQWEP